MLQIISMSKNKSASQPLLRKEFQLIQRYFSEHQQTTRSDLLLGIGDDCAIVAPRKQANVAFSIDTLISGVHFPDNTTADAIAYKALAVNLSDLAAMGAEPAWFTLALSLPDHHQWSEQHRNKWLKDFSKALFSLAKEHNIQLIGGDTTASPILSITIQVCGYLEKNTGLTRSGAQPDDIIAVTGKLGGASVGLDLLLETHNNAYNSLSENDKQQAIHALNYPQARIQEGLYLKHIAHSALDLSDGLLSDLGHILKASQVGAQLYLDKLPLADALSCLSDEQAWNKALSGGDDYELCFTIAPRHWARVREKFPHCVAIGRVTKEETVQLITPNSMNFKAQQKGYDHFG